MKTYKNFDSWFNEFRLWNADRAREDRDELTFRAAEKVRVAEESARNEARLLAWRLKRAHRCTYDLAPHQNTTNIANKPAPER